MSSDVNSIEVARLTTNIGHTLSGFDMPVVLTVLTYLSADACIQSNMDEDEFLTRFVYYIRLAVNNIKEEENGNRSHH
jgi:hypothetical protein